VQHGDVGLYGVLGDDTQMSIRINGRKMTYGADPEMFVFSGQKLLPAFEFLPCKSPHTRRFWDGFQAEWRYNESEFCLDLFVLKTQTQMHALLKAARKYDAAAKLSLASVVRIPQSLLDSADDPYVELGCLPSWNAYGRDGLDVENPRALKFRFAGGHMHFGGWQRPPCHEKIVKTLDAILGVWSVGAAKNLDIPCRRRYYGLAGEYRKPFYEPDEVFGVEWRTLSNFWLCHPGIMHLVWEIGRKAVQLACSTKPNLWAAGEEEVQEAINNCDVRLAAKILTRNRPMFNAMFADKRWSDKVRAKTFSVGLDGVESVVSKPHDIEDNWDLGNIFDNYVCKFRWKVLASK
jgi:hypothetical protein